MPIDDLLSYHLFSSFCGSIFVNPAASNGCQYTLAKSIARGFVRVGAHGDVLTNQAGPTGHARSGHTGTLLKS